MGYSLQSSKWLRRCPAIWAICWLLWLLIQHAGWMIHWTTLDGTQIDLIQAHDVCTSPLYSDVQALGYSTTECSQQANYWALSTFLFWVGLVALAVYVYAVLKRRRAAKLAPARQLDGARSFEWNFAYGVALGSGQDGWRFLEYDKDECVMQWPRLTKESELGHIPHIAHIST